MIYSSRQHQRGKEKASSGSAQRKPEGKSPKGKDTLGVRAIEVMKTIADQDGGPAKTAHLATHWPPDVPTMLRYQGVDAATVSALMNQYPPEYLGQRVELTKFLYKLARTVPGELASLDPLYQQVLTLDPGEWILRAIASDLEAPEVFTNRVRHDSEFISSAAKTGLRRLVDAGMVTVDELPVRRREGSGQYLYYLTPKGRRRLAEELGVNIKQIAYRRPGQLSDFKMLHHLQCVDLAFSIRLSCQRLGYRLIQEYTDSQLKDLMGSHPVTYKMRRYPDDPDSVEEVEGSTAPDYFFMIEANGKIFAHLVEVDRGFSPVRSSKPGLRDFKRRVAILSEVYKSRLYHQLFPLAGNSYRYLVITNAGVDARGVHDRVRSLKSAAEEALREVSENDREAHLAGQRYLFARWSEAVKPSTTDYFSTYTLLDGPWWLQAGDEANRPRALIW